jgi:outer membrane receptor protein involved in Fe transport
MPVPRSNKRLLVVAALTALLFGVSRALQAVEPDPNAAKPAAAAAKSDPAVVQAQDTAPAAPTPATSQPAPTSQPAGEAAGGGGRSASQLEEQFKALAPPTSTVAPGTAEKVSAPPAADVAIGGAAAAAINANDVTQLLLKSDNVTGVQTQQRSPTTFDPRIRGLHVGQIATYGDGGFFFPARIDLDTALSKFDPSSIQDVIVIKGPYSVRYGPGFAFLDITSFGANLTTDGSYEVHGRTELGYQTNGRRWDGLQALWFGSPDLGVRFSYDIRTGQDYTAGNDQEISSSYNNQNFNFSAILRLTENSTVEFKGLEVLQHNLDFPGLYFDLSRLDTQAYSLRFRYDDPEGYGRARADLWYNYTSANGDTHTVATQTQDQGILKQSFTPVPLPGQPPPTPVTFIDFSTTNFDELVSGFRTFYEIGKVDGARAALGADLNVVRLHLAENIRLLPTSAVPAGIGTPDPFLTQNQSIPESRSIDPGLFLDGSLPVGERLVMHGGLRADFIYTSSDDRLVTGNSVLVPGTQNGTMFPGQSIGPALPAVPGQPAVGSMTTFDPIVYSADPTDPNLARHFSLFSSYLNGEYKLDEHLTAKMGIADAQRAPTLTELYAAGPFVGVLQQGLNRLVGDPHLSPETSRQLDIGLAANYERLRFNVNGFYNWIDNYITFDQNKTSTALAGALTQVVFTNTNEATLAGGEAYVEYDLLDFFTPFGSMSYVQGEDLTHIDNRRGTFMGNPLTSSRRTVDTEPLPGIPPLELRGGFRIHDPAKKPKWSIEFVARSVMGQDNVATTLGELPTSGFTIFDLRAFWQVNDLLLVSGGVENIGDKLYMEALDPRAGNFFGNPFFRPGTNFYVTAQLSY